MAWNEPGGGDNKDPWGNRGDQGPPDLDEAIRKLQAQLSGIFGGKGGSDGGGDLFVGGYTSHDDDAVALAQIGDVWTSGDPYNDIVTELTDSGGLLEVGVSVFGDDDEDKLDGAKKAADLFFAEVGLDELKGEDDDTVISL